MGQWWTRHCSRRKRTCSTARCRQLKEFTVEWAMVISGAITWEMAFPFVYGVAKMFKQGKQKIDNTVGLDDDVSPGPLSFGVSVLIKRNGKNY